MVVVISYRESWEWSCNRGCHSDSEKSSFGVRSFDTVEEVVEFITERLYESPRAEFDHIILESWDDVLKVCDGGMGGGGTGLHSIYSLYDPVSDDDFEHYDEYKKRQDLRDEVHERVKTRLAELAEADKKQAAEEKARADAEREDKQLERDKAELERLKTKLGKN